jgi:hypothetical protein
MAMVGGGRDDFEKMPYIFGLLSHSQRLPFTIN